ncbi:hypothetical protein C0992_000305, partial [Termitomyces sp. T32_za158]
MQERIAKSLFVSQFCRKYWAVYRGKKSGIYTQWAGKGNAEAQLEVADRYRALHFEFSTLRGALIFMVSKATCCTGDDVPEY